MGIRTVERRWGGRCIFMLIRRGLKFVCSFPSKRTVGKWPVCPLGNHPRRVAHTPPTFARSERSERDLCVG